MAKQPPNLNDPAVYATWLEHYKHKYRLEQEAKRAVAAERQAARQLPEMLTLRDRLAQPRRVVPWRIGLLQGCGHRVLLASQFKAGKTTLVMNVIRSVVDGQPFLDTYTASDIGGTAVVLDFEMGENQLADWYRSVAIQNDDRVIVIPFRGAATCFNILEPDIRTYWVERLRTWNTQYLALDCLRPMFDAIGLDEHKEAGLFLTEFDRLLREADIPDALVVQHMGHQNERARGDSRLLDWPDVLWTLVRQKTKDNDEDLAGPRFFKAFGRDVNVPELQLSHNAETRRLGVAGGSRVEVKVTVALSAIVDFVAQSPVPPSGNQVEKAVMASGVHTQSAVRMALQEGIRTGVLVPDVGKRNAILYRMANSSSLPHSTNSKKSDAEGDDEPAETMDFS